MVEAVCEIQNDCIAVVHDALEVTGCADLVRRHEARYVSPHCYLRVREQPQQVGARVPTLLQLKLPHFKLLLIESELLLDFLYGLREGGCGEGLAGEGDVEAAGGLDGEALELLRLLLLRLVVILV